MCWGAILFCFRATWVPVGWVKVLGSVDRLVVNPVAWSTLSGHVHVHVHGSDLLRYAVAMTIERTSGARNALRKMVRACASMCVYVCLCVSVCVCVCLCVRTITCRRPRSRHGPQPSVSMHLFPTLLVVSIVLLFGTTAAPWPTLLASPPLTTPRRVYKDTLCTSPSTSHSWWRRLRHP